MKRPTSATRASAPKPGPRAAIALVAAAVLTPAAAFAGEATVHGDPKAVSVEAANTPVADILAALNKSFGVRVNTTANLDKPLSGTYEGSLSQVVSRVLEGYNFIVRSSKDRIEVSVFGSGSGTTVARTSPAPHTAPAATASAASTASAKNTRVEQTPPAAPPSPAVAKDQPSTGPSSPAAPSVIKVAEGPTPPMPTPSTDGAKGPVPIATPSNVAPPMPVLPPPGSEPMKGPMPTKSDVEPPQFSAMAKSGGAAPPLPKDGAVSPAPTAQPPAPTAQPPAPKK